MGPILFFSINKKTKGKFAYFSKLQASHNMATCCLRTVILELCDWLVLLYRSSQSRCQCPPPLYLPKSRDWLTRFSVSVAANHAASAPSLLNTFPIQCRI